MKTYFYEFLGDRKEEIAKPAEIHTEFELSALINVFYNNFTPSFRFAGERHNFYEFFYVVSGKMITSVNMKKYRMSAGEYILVPPMLYHGMEPDNCYATGITVSFDSENYPLAVFGGKLSSFGKQLLTNIVNIYADNVENSELRKKVFPNILNNNNYGYSHSLKVNVENLILIILQNYMSSVKDSGVKIKADNEVAEKTRQYLESHFKENPSLNEIAHDLHYSVSYICKKFKQKYDASITDYIIKLKIYESLKLIEQNNLSLREISDELGFNGVAYFSRIFKKIVGTTPSSYRKSAIYSHIINPRYVPSEFILK